MIVFLLRVEYWLNWKYFEVTFERLVAMAHFLVATRRLQSEPRYQENEE